MRELYVQQWTEIVWNDNKLLIESNVFQAVYHTIEHEAPDPDADSSIEPEANDLDAYIGKWYKTANHIQAVIEMREQHVIFSWFTVALEIVKVL